MLSSDSGSEQACSWLEFADVVSGAGDGDQKITEKVTMMPATERRHHRRCSLRDCCVTRLLNGRWAFLRRRRRRWFAVLGRW